MTLRKSKLLLLVYVNTSTSSQAELTLPLGLQIISSAAKSCGWDVLGKYWDSQVTEQRFKEHITECKPDVIGFFVDMINSYSVQRLIKRLPEELRPFIIIGGPEPSFNYRQVCEKIPADIIVRGPGEKIIKKLLSNDYKSSVFLKTVSGISYKYNNKYIHNPSAKDEDNDDIFPDRELIPDERKILYLYTAVGCPNRCSFCSESSVKFKPRKRENIERELKEVFSVSKPEWILIVDDSFTGNIKHCKSLLPFLKKEYAGPWSCELTARSIVKNPGLSKELVDAGLVRAQIGIESLNDETLDLYRKNVTKDDILKCIDILLNDGVKCVFGNFIVGAPGETEEMINNNIEEAKKLISKYPGRVELSASVLSYNPGAPFFDKPEKYCLNLTERSILGATDLRSPAISTDKLSRYKILMMHEKFNNIITSQTNSELKNIPQEIIETHLRFYHLNLNTIWSQKLLSAKHIYNYYMMVYYEKSHKSLSKIPYENIIDSVPQRTYMQIQLSIDGNVILTNLSGEYQELNDTASFMYEMACGMHTVYEIAKMVTQHIHGASSVPFQRILDDTVDFYKKMARKMHIVYLLT